MLMHFFPEFADRRSMLFSEIAEAVERGDVDAGVLIHEGRFVYERRNLELVADLGALWEKQTLLPLPLGAIVIHRDLGEQVQREVESLLSESIRFAFANPALSRTYIKSHAQELEDDVIDRHIDLFVNDYSISLGQEGRRATARLTGLDL